MLNAADFTSHPFAGGADFVAALPDLNPGCIILDLRMPQVDGFEVMAELQRQGIDWPIIVVTGHGEVTVAVRAMKLGALEFLEKPFTEDALLTCLKRAFPLLQERELLSERRRAATKRIASLTNREAEVLECLLAGHSNKTMAEVLGISLRTVEMHRGNMMERLQANSLAEAVTLAIDAGFRPTQTRES